jgi:hypothetical protein
MASCQHMYINLTGWIWVSLDIKLFPLSLLTPATRHHQHCQLYTVNTHTNPPKKYFPFPYSSFPFHQCHRPECLSLFSLSVFISSLSVSSSVCPTAPLWLTYIKLRPFPSPWAIYEHRPTNPLEYLSTQQKFQLGLGMSFQGCGRGW